MIAATTETEFGTAAPTRRAAESSPCTVARVQDGRYAAWDTFVQNHEFGSIFHTMAWRDTVERTFGHEDIYLLAARDGVIVGVLPMFLVNSRFAGRLLMSVPCAVEGGVLGYAGGKKSPDDHAGQEQDAHVHPVVGRGRDPQHESDREQGTREGGCGERPGKRGRQAHRKGENRSGGSPPRDSEDVGLGKRIAKQSLENGTRERESAPDQDGHRRSGGTEIHHDPPDIDVSLAT